MILLFVLSCIDFYFQIIITIFFFLLLIFYSLNPYFCNCLIEQIKLSILLFSRLLLVILLNSNSQHGFLRKIIYFLMLGTTCIDDIINEVLIIPDFETEGDYFCFIELYMDNCHTIKHDKGRYHVVTQDGSNKA